MESMKMGALRMLVDSYYDVQDQRIRAAHRIRQYSDAEALVDCVGKEAETAARLEGPEAYAKALKAVSKSDEFATGKEKAVLFLSGWHDEIDKRMSSSEGYLQRKVQKLLNDEPLWADWLVDVRGIGPCLAGGIMAWLDPAKAPHRSSFWKYAGLAVINGEQEKRRRGEKIAYVPKLKTMCWKIGESFVKQTTPTPSAYRALYEKYRRKVDTQPCTKEHVIDGKVIECFDAHKFAKAKRLTVKMFIAHVWEVWRKMEGLPVEAPFPMAHKGHTMNDYVPPLRDSGEFAVGLLEAA